MQRVPHDDLAEHMFLESNRQPSACTAVHSLLMLIHICMRDVARIEMHVLIMKYMEHRFDALAVARNSRMRDGSVH